MKPSTDSLAWAQNLDVSPRRLEEHVNALNYPRNRLDWPEAMMRAEGYVRESWSPPWQFNRMEFTVDSSLMEFAENLDLVQRRRLPGACGANLIAFRPGPQVSEEGVLVVGAHLDTLKHTSGADDNTSAIAVLLELARVLAPCDFRRGLALVAFDMEEWNLLGSRALVDRLPWKVGGAVVLECVGYYSDAPNSQTLPPGLEHLFPQQWKRISGKQFRGDFAAVIYRAPAVEMARRLVGAFQALSSADSALLLQDPADLTLVGKALASKFPFLKNLTRSDHAPFWERGIPALMVTDTAEFRNPYYHTDQDLPHRLDYGRMALVVRATACLLADLAGRISP